MIFIEIIYQFVNGLMHILLSSENIDFLLINIAWKNFYNPSSGDIRVSDAKFVTMDMFRSKFFD